MPTYLCHGFRWARMRIRAFVIIEDLEDAAPDWITAPGSSTAILERFSTKFDYLPRRLAPQTSGQPSERQSEQLWEQPKQEERPMAHQQYSPSVPTLRGSSCEGSALAHHSSAVRLLEEYDPEETSSPSRPFAYVADHAIRIDLSANVLEEMAKYEALAKERNEGNWLERLRDELQAGAPIEWYVVVNGDEERGVPQYDDEDSSEGDLREMEDVRLGDEEENGPRREQQQTARSAQPRTKNRQHGPSKSIDQPHSLRRKMSRAGLRRLFSKSS
ncbi:lbe protein [Trichoderma cornu-damae]|uniref:Lbe protein n=1 Tax=Trichoderma cornu-damae TaxID=654480 RepID=A0A9P8TTU7_9HYPO|nr:lbe protein [Trichoderma cornu-damae]